MLTFLHYFLLFYLFSLVTLKRIIYVQIVDVSKKDVRRQNIESIGTFYQVDLYKNGNNEKLTRAYSKPYKIEKDVQKIRSHDMFKQIARFTLQAHHDQLGAFELHLTAIIRESNGDLRELTTEKISFHYNSKKPLVVINIGNLGEVVTYKSIQSSAFPTYWAEFHLFLQNLKAIFYKLTLSCKNDTKILGFAKVDLNQRNVVIQRSLLDKCILNDAHNNEGIKLNLHLQTYVNKTKIGKFNRITPEFECKSSPINEDLPNYYSIEYDLKENKIACNYMKLSGKLIKLDMTVEDISHLMGKRKRANVTLAEPNATASANDRPHKRLRNLSDIVGSSSRQNQVHLPAGQFHSSGFQSVENVTREKNVLNQPQKSADENNPIVGFRNDEITHEVVGKCILIKGERETFFNGNKETVRQQFKWRLPIAAPAAHSASQMSVDERGDMNYVIDTTGYHMSELNVDVQGNEIVVVGDHVEQNQPTGTFYCRLERRLVIPEHIDIESIKCKFEIHNQSHFIIIQGKKHASRSESRRIPIEFNSVGEVPRP